MNELSRNDLCWCGSGEKYKRCHMELDQTINQYRRKGYTVPPRHLRKTPEQVEGIRRSGKLTTQILDLVADQIEVGVTTREIDEWVYDFTMEHGAYPAPLNYRGFPKSVCTSINEVICHGIPDDTVLQEGDIINVDVSTVLDGYFSDASRMFMIGEVSDEAARLVRVTKECLDLGLEQVRPYNSLNDIGRVIEHYATKHGYSVVRDLGGHGVGLEFHEPIYVDHYEKPGKGLLLLPGLVFTIEPMINQGRYDCEILSDGWTVKTRDRKLSAQWEYTVLVTETGSEILAC